VRGWLGRSLCGDEEMKGWMEVLGCLVEFELESSNEKQGNGFVLQC
jgi:hypothetical protein